LKSVFIISLKLPSVNMYVLYVKNVKELEMHDKA